MTNVNTNSYTMVFAVAVCVVMSTVLALLANVLRPIQDASAEFDRQKNVMMAAGLIERGDPRPRAELEQLYKDRVDERVVDTRTGDVVPGKTAADIKALNEQAAAEDPTAGKPFRVVAMAKDERQQLDAIVLPVSGKGLWSTLYGYLALESDGDTVRGITFYKHGETPGLGGEVENPQWTAMWEGKQILGEGGELVSITVKKGKVDPSIAKEKRHYVDGLAGATITSNGVTKFVRNDLETFRPYLASVAQKN